MASNYSNDIKLELITTGEKAGTWGTVTNTNLQILEQAASGYLSLSVGAADVALSLANGAVSDGKNLYFKLTGTLVANRTVTMPDNAERVFIVEDATDRTSSLYSLTVKTVSGTGINLPIKSTSLIYSDGTNVSLGLQNKGYAAINGTYTAVNGDQILVDTSSTPVTITLPVSPSVGDQVALLDAKNFFASNNLTVARNGENINALASNLVVSTNGAAFTLVYANATVGWIYTNKL
tara:strand:- start:2474 stop:3181 length:708 start_codon:yes stop_codon:yes gene_type:complete